MINCKKIILYISGIVLIGCFGACNDAPTGMGMPVLPDTIAITYMGEGLAGDSNYALDKAQNGTASILIGAANQLRAGAILRYEVPAGMEWLTEDDIVSAELIFFTQRYAFGDTLGSNHLAFEVKEVVKTIPLESITAEDVLNSNYLYGNAPPIAAWDGSINYAKDTLDSVSVPLPKSLCIDWFKKVSTQDTINGLAVLPQSTGTVINQFADGGSSSQGGFRSCFKVVFRTAEGTDSTIKMYPGWVSKFVLNDDKIDNSFLAVQGAVRKRCKLNFDISQIPKLAMITLAELTLTLDEEKSYHGNDTLDNSVRLLLYKNKNTDYSDTAGYWPATGNRIEGTNKYVFRDEFFAGEMMHIYQYLEGKGTLTLAPIAAAEYNKVNRLIFHGLDAADESKRPKLKIVYNEVKLGK